MPSEVLKPPLFVRPGPGISLRMSGADARVAIVSLVVVDLM